jgi:hypothetical protein
MYCPKGFNISAFSLLIEASKIGQAKIPFSIEFWQGKWGKANGEKGSENAERRTKTSVAGV